MRFKILTQGAILMAVSGCNTISDGGSPSLGFDLQNDLKKVAEKTATSVDGYYENDGTQTVSNRNRIIINRLLQIDIAYLIFVKELTREKILLDSAAEISILTLSIAGTLSGGAQAKTNLAAAVALVTGSKTTIDKNYFYDKTMPSLIAAMNSKRKSVYVSILTGMKQTTDVYPLSSALMDISRYYEAGTLNGALTYIEAVTAEIDLKSDKQIEKLMTKALSVEVLNNAKLLRSLVDSKKGKINLTDGKAALKELGDTNADTLTTTSQVDSHLDDLVRNLPFTGDPDTLAERTAETIEILKKHNIK
jgi:hypothetical protein